MKRIALALIATAAALAANTASAGTDVRIGVNIGGPSYRPAPPVVIAPPVAPVVVAPRGYWKEVPVKVWVPERWVVRTNRWGRSERVCEPGYYTYTTNRVWVDTSYDHRGHDHGRGWGYNDRRDDDRRDGRRDDWRR